MNARSALAILRAEASRHQGDLRGALEIAVGVLDRHLARRDRQAANRKTDICDGCVGAGLGGCRSAYNADDPKHAICEMERS